MAADFIQEQGKQVGQVEVPDDEIITTLSFDLETKDGGHLKYLSLRHSTDPKNKQHELMAAEVLNYKPDYVLYEGPENPLVDTSRVEAIQKCGGELGLVRWLVVQSNKNLEADSKPVEAHSFDLTSEEWVDGFKDLGYSNEEIAIFDVARRVYREATNAIKNGQEFGVIEANFENQFSGPSVQGNLLYELDLLPRGDGKPWTLDLLKEEYKQRTHQELNFAENNEMIIETSYITTLKKMFEDERVFKDELMVQKIEDALKTHKRVLVVAGSGHAIAQKPILEKIINSSEADEAGQAGRVEQNGGELSPDELIKFVVEKGELPLGFDSEKLQAMNDMMTQEEIVEYHVAMNTVSDFEKRQKLLNEWIPKPHVLYHVSPDGVLTEFTPKPSSRTKDEPDSVFAGTTKAVCAMFSIKSPDIKSGSYDGGKTQTVIVGNVDEFLNNDKGGYLYTLPPENFGVNPNLGLGLAEWTSTSPVTQIGVEHFDSAIQFMLDNGVKIILANADIMRKLRDPSVDDLSVLKDFKPIQTLEELRDLAE